MNKLQLLSKEDMLLINGGGKSDYDFGHEIGHDIYKAGHKVIKHLSNARVCGTSGYGVNTPGYGISR
ncbi:hypothetical protein JW813_02580 [Clostridium botulinum]|uniref:hypothetical protein n=1 Tax=Clostridium botulinum TaxID=1491 RepID=UPI00144EE39C|nr:hypothetical protein [Clostridium botulinum]NFO03899.1 hypothetical protein [Clostridium botulinum]UZP03901.1 hypothetical protein JW813_02580 [Clostridium botulinum]UZP07257.1 hypothetical protein JYA71_02575 [Clostridium botulinum]UZP10639.1 hypothetical protein JYA74_02575 [Clostridium botulinum]